MFWSCNSSELLQELLHEQTGHERMYENKQFYTSAKNIVPHHNDCSRWFVIVVSTMCMWIPYVPSS